MRLPSLSFPDWSDRVIEPRLDMETPSNMWEGYPGAYNIMPLPHGYQQLEGDMAVPGLHFKPQRVPEFRTPHVDGPLDPFLLEPAALRLFRNKLAP